MLLISLATGHGQTREVLEAERGKQEQRAGADAATLQARRLLYAANMKLAQEAWEMNDAALLREVLEEAHGNPERGFEYYFWQRQAHRAVQTFRGHQGYVMAAAFSPDGRRIVTGSSDNTAKVWEVATGREVFTLTGHEAPIECVAFGPDGRWIVTGGEDLTARIWDGETGKELHTLRGHSNSVSEVSISQDGKRVYASCFDGTTRAWDPVSGEELFHEDLSGIGTRRLALSPEHHLLVIGSSSILDSPGEIEVWDTAKRKQRFALKEGERFIQAAAISPDGQQVVTTIGDNLARIWDAWTGQELRVIEGRQGGLSRVGFSGDGQRVVLVGIRTVEVWDVESGRELFSFDGQCSWDCVLAVSPDATRMVSRDRGDFSVKLWEAERAPIPVGGMGAALSPDASHGVTAGGVVLTSDAITGGRVAYLGSSDKRALIWEMKDGKQRLALAGHQWAVLSVDWSPDGGRIVTGSWDGSTRIWNAADGQTMLTLKDERLGAIKAVAFSPDGRRVATVGNQGWAGVWDCASGRMTCSFGLATNETVQVAFSPDNRRIITAAGEETAHVWEADSGRELLILRGHRGAVTAVAFSPDNQQLLTGSADHTAKLWNASTGRELITLRGHHDEVLSVGFSPDGLRIVTGSADHTARVWDATIGRDLLTLKWARARETTMRWTRLNFDRVAFSADGRQLFGAGYAQVMNPLPIMEGAANLWKSASPDQVAAWRREESENKK
jgi:WD40 repeat protein